MAEFGVRSREREELSKLLDTLVPLSDDPVQALYGMLKDGPSLTADLLVEHAREMVTGDPEFKLLENSLSIRWITQQE